MSIFKSIERHPLYEISEDGVVRNKATKHILKVQEDNEYIKIKLDGKTEYVSRLVAEAFLNKEAGKEYIRHKDNNSKNNHYKNLEWSTKRDIQKSFYGLGVNAPGGNEKPKKVMIKETGEIFSSIRSCARHISGEPNGIRKYLKGELKSYKGYTFKIF